MQEGTTEAYQDFLKMRRTLDAMRGVIGNEAFNAFIRSLKDDDLHSWDQRRIVTDARPDIAGELMISPILDALKRVQDYRAKRSIDQLRYNQGPTFTGRWESRLNSVTSAFNSWREKVKVSLYFGKNADVIDGLKDSRVSTAGYYGNELRVKIKVNARIFTKVMPLFNGGEIHARDHYSPGDGRESWDHLPQVERLGNTRTGKYFQYLIYDIGEPVFDFPKDQEIVPMENGIRAYPVDVIEVVGPLGDRSLDVSKKWLAFMGKHIKEDTVTAVHDSPRQAYNLCRQRLCRDMVAQL
jgi:hypothetical protein